MVPGVCGNAINGPGMESVDKNQRASQLVRMGVYLIPLALSTFVGCVDGPLYELKKLNPVIQSQWKKDQERGPTYYQRIDELDLVTRQITTMPPDEKARWINTVSQVAQTDTSPEIRWRSVQTLAKVIDQPAAIESIMKLSQDKNDKVRLAVSQSLKKQVTPETTQTLLAMATTDKSESVRLAAVESLGMHKSEDVKSFLTKQINDRSPAMQYSASLALKDFTGKDFKGDVPLLKRYLNGENVEPKEASFYEAVQPYWPFKR
jgi:hypothetical protein